MSKTNSTKTKRKIKGIEKIIRAGMDIEEISTQKAREMGFMVKALVTTTLPHSKPKEDMYIKTNGDYKLIVSNGGFGIPYGTYPRLFYAYITTQAVKTKSRRIDMGDSLNQFLKVIGKTSTGGKTGTITSFKSQLKKILSATIQVVYDTERVFDIEPIRVTEKARIYWDTKKGSADQLTLFDSHLTLTKEFFEQVMKNAVPYDMRALKAFASSSLQIDIYIWLILRLSYLTRDTFISWKQLSEQFGSNYKRTRKFKEKFIEGLGYVLCVYKSAGVEVLDKGILLYKSPLHIGRS